MKKSFELKFDLNGNVEMFNIKGVEGLACLDVTKPYVESLEDKDNPAETIIHDTAKNYVKTEQGIDELA